MFSSVLMRIATIAADGIPSDTASSLTSTLSTLALPLILIVVVVVMMVVSSRSNKKRQKQYESMLAEIKPGTRVRTIGGIYGTVTKVQDDVVIVSVGPDKARLVFTKQAIANIEDAPVEATIEGEIRETEKK
ncbi:MAG: preprotein translocase subunit YajC [Eubacteriales bacterium]|nr:preprotein translocase subunit YajC [Eubacteriales bacterium]MDD7522860.1 preprotein translocase subunit YajC [Clostridiales bacterium]MDD7688385.1 preprotein translocase subunit YajC [Clostridiales bacterium]MDY2597172.1 preprotein translocase subunit YajC [Eubacteriales bacterium]MDY4622527.1 preprotein translocase subunit YajC [Eubacteriales bacterium]